jgi:hypothetical protein
MGEGFDGPYWRAAAPSDIGTESRLSGCEGSDTEQNQAVLDEKTEKRQRDLSKWEELYTRLDRAVGADDRKKADKLFEILCDQSQWGASILNRPWSKMEKGGNRKWRGDGALYPTAYRVIDGIREAWVCMLMDNCDWDKAVRVCDQTIFDESCMYLSSKAQIALNKLHALLESRKMQEAFSFMQRILDDHPRMVEIHKVILEMHGYQWHYTLARIHFLHNELDKAQQHAEGACAILETNMSDIEEPLQSRLWVNMIRAWTRGINSLLSKDATEVNKNIELWESSVCELDRRAVASTAGLSHAPTFGRLKFVNFLMIAIRAFPELEITTYAECAQPENRNVIMIGKLLLKSLRAVTSELLSRGKVSVEVTNERYNPILDEALVLLGYMSTSLEGMLNNWALIIDAGPVGNEARFANHTDDPNAVLAIGTFQGVRVRVLKAVKRIFPGDEVTVHYGCTYWDAVIHHRTKGMQTKATRVVTVDKKRKGNKSSSSVRFVKEDTTDAFTYFDGIIPDLNGSGLPGKLLLQMLGENGTCSEVHDMELSQRKKGLRVEDCPPDHAAYPGKRLVADKEFSPGDELCVYGGMLIRIPASQLKLNDSDHISSVCGHINGAYGFALEMGDGEMVFKENQHELPVLTPIINGTCIPNADPPADLSRIRDIKGLGYEATRYLVDSVQDPSKHELITRLLKKLRNFPDKNWKQSALAEIKRVFSHKRPHNAITKTRDEPPTATHHQSTVIELSDSESADPDGYEPPFDDQENSIPANAIISPKARPPDLNYALVRYMTSEPPVASPLFQKNRLSN